MRVLVPPSSLRVLLSNLKVLWRQWNIQTMVLASFSIQLILILLVPFRKQTSNKLIIGSVWLAYLLADWVAIQSIGLISNPCGSTTTSTSNVESELYAFWAQFLLLHLGGPDTITALALEDNELWLRTGLHLGVQVYGSLGVLVKSVGQAQTSLCAPTFLIFIAGIIKYLERVSSLFHGRLLKFSNHQLDRAARRMLNWLEPDDCHEDYPDDVESSKKELTDAEMVRDAFYFFHDYKGLYAGEQFSYSHSLFSCRYLCKRTPEEAFRVLEIQFNLAYEVFYTKTVLICTKLLWKVLRLVVTLLQVGCLVMWLFFTDKNSFKNYNIQITYTLLFGAIAVDVFAFLRIKLWSDWSIAQFNKRDPTPSKASFHNMLLSARKRTWGRYSRKEDAPIWEWLRRAVFRRWSESIPQLSLLSLCLGERSNKVFELFGVKEELERGKYVRHKWFSDRLRDFIYDDLRQKLKIRGCPENIGRVKGGWACIYLMSNYQREMITIPDVCKLLDIRGEYDMTLMRWYIITELCYYGDHFPVDDSIDAEDNFIKRLVNKLLIKEHKPNTSTTEKKKTKLEEEEENYREICKIISDYMMYLLVHQQELLPLPAITNLRLQHTYKELKKELKEYFAYETIKMEPDKRKKARRYLACRLIRQKYTYNNLRAQMPHSFPIEQILNDLGELEEKKVGKWEFMAKVWGELLYYAAIRCKPSIHAAKLKQGGEFLSFVWLLMVQMGFGLYESETSRYQLSHEEIEPTKALLHKSDTEGCMSPR